ncbi:aldehyde dehydrogenase (NADP(+)) [Pseudoalteromonas piscicida]|uniref:aldehyde dehydrogenase (NADP(+)) n=1 Tax=Pseudoalteromonas piscicida TaxID=43662 RepID=UPI001EFCA7CF|nr:aldehyde dehydrogenase (NADP(+)) [Pseudoalteromonas piscicida]MCG9771451.1 aldehyde dehydrogenase (NADP(+)) [Pseudoalteromonas piscicida]
MNLSGKSYINGAWQAAQAATKFYAFCPATNEPLTQAFFNASEAQVEEAVNAAEQAFKAYRKTSMTARAEFLETIAQEILALGDELITTTMAETNLPRPRLEGERGRTVNQLNAFAAALRDNLAELSLDKEEQADPNRTPLPKPKTQLKHIPIGVIAVFGASNFPYAFSTLGGDTAAALAAGCPVVYKGHPAHPATCELMTKAIATAISKCDIPSGVFSMLQAKAYDVAHCLVKASPIKAVGFTGSFGVAKALQDTIAKRHEPIPLYGELGSVNPQIVLPEKVQSQGAELGAQFVQSLLMGNGQFCTSPGIWLVPSSSSQAFIEMAKQNISEAPSDTLLTPGILKAYQNSIAALKVHPQVTLLSAGEQAQPFHASAHLFLTDSESFATDARLKEEVFGPSALVVSYDNLAQLEDLIADLDGQLTASIHGTESDLHQAEDIIEALQYRVGRLIYGQMPTGVEVCATMNHGGPFPSSTDVRSTSVGLEALKRFVRPICIQS